MKIDDSTELRLGDYREALADVDEVDAVIVDAPYSARTHGRHNNGASRAGWLSSGVNCDGVQRRAIDYSGFSDDDVRAFCDLWSPRCRGWFVTITDDVLAPVWSAALAMHGRYVFAPLPWYAPGSRARLSGDGPSSWTCWIVVARPRSGTFRDGTAANRWGTLPGGYNITQDRCIVVGGKPIALMRALVRDYTRPGDLVVDPCAGGGTTLRACQLEGRRSIGAELDPDTHAKAVERLRAPYSRPLLLDAPTPKQVDWIDGGES